MVTAIKVDRRGLLQKAQELYQQKISENGMNHHD
jgi:hypothetical protein